MEPTLPMPPQESHPARVSPDHDGGYQVEQGAAQPPERVGELTPVVSPVSPAPTSAPVVPAQSATQGQAVAPTIVGDDSPQIADDVDVIEKEWVDKAKKIVDSTKSDPHEQEKQVGKLQADYMLKRYNKQIKTVE